MLNNKSKLSILAMGLALSFITACSGEYQPARDVPAGDSTGTSDSSGNHMQNNMNDTASNPGMQDTANHQMQDTTNGRMK